MEGFSPNESQSVLCTLKVGIHCFLLDNHAYAVRHLFPKNKTRPVCLLWKSSKVGNVPVCWSLQMKGTAFVVFTLSSLCNCADFGAGEPYTYGKASFCKSFKTVLFTVLTRPSNSRTLIIVSWVNVRIIDRRLWGCSFSLTCIFSPCHFAHCLLIISNHRGKAHFTCHMIYSSPELIILIIYLICTNIFISLSFFKIIFTFCHKHMCPFVTLSNTRCFAFIGHYRVTTDWKHFKHTLSKHIVNSQETHVLVTGKIDSLLLQTTALCAPVALRTL